MKLFKDLYEYRELLKTNVKKDIRGKYKGSVLGVLWSFLNPLLMVLVYAIVFPYIMRIETDNYLQYLICGVIPWNFFTTVMGLGIGSIKNFTNFCFFKWSCKFFYCMHHNYFILCIWWFRNKLAHIISAFYRNNSIYDYHWISTRFECYKCLYPRY